MNISKNYLILFFIGASLGIPNITFAAAGRQINIINNSSVPIIAHVRGGSWGINCNTANIEIGKNHNYEPEGMCNALPLQVGITNFDTDKTFGSCDNDPIYFGLSDDPNGSPHQCSGTITVTGFSNNTMQCTVTYNGNYPEGSC